MWTINVEERLNVKKKLKVPLILEHTSFIYESIKNIYVYVHIFHLQIHQFFSELNSETEHWVNHHMSICVSFLIWKLMFSLLSNFNEMPFMNSKSDSFVEVPKSK